MHTIISGWLAGLVVGVIGSVYVLFRSEQMQGEREFGKVHPEAEREASFTLITLAILCSGSIVWGFIGVGLYQLIHDALVFFLITFLLAGLAALLMWRDGTVLVRDKMILAAIIFIGLGILIPWLYKVLKIFD